MLDWSYSQDSNRVYVSGAALDFAKSLNLGPSSVKVGIIPFDTNPIYPFVLPITEDRDVILQSLTMLGKTPPTGGTLFPSSLKMAINFFNESAIKRNEEVIKIIIFISDGEEYFGNFGLETDKEMSQNLATELKESGCFIWCINTSHSKLRWPTYHLKGLSSGNEYYLERNYTNLKEELLRLQICP
jgi:Mg-chelatase subunit ChlD